jgi:predicted amidohydrolase YtcJ
LKLLIENCSVLGGKTRSVLVDGGLIARTSDGDTQSVSSDTDRIDGNGGTLVTGLVDTHCHPFEFGWLKRNVDLRGTSSVTGLRLRVSARIHRSSPGQWVVGMGWDHEQFPGRKMPSKSDLDDISPRNPVALRRIDGHIALLNSRAIDALGLESRAGEEYERGPDGALTGIVKERALPDVFSSVRGTAQEAAADLLSVEVEAARFGLTKLHCIVSPEGYREELEALASLRREGHLSIRYRVYIPPEAMGFVAESGTRKELSDEVVRLNGVKLYADGSLGSRTAALRQPYSDDPSNSGLLRYSDEELAELVEKADSAGYQVIVHAIGDRAIEQAIGAISRVSGANNPRRHRIEHASLVPPDLRSKMAKREIRASVQPCFITSDTWAVERLGEERAADLYPLKSILQQGILASGSSDSPVETLSPVIGAWAAMARAGIAPEESLSLGEALTLYTKNADSNGVDDDAGLREDGPASLTLFDSNVDGMHPALFRKVGISAVVVGGVLVHSNY